MGEARRHGGVRGNDEGEHLYFAVETKGALFADDLRDRERAKIACGKAHFEALSVGENPARYRRLGTSRMSSRAPDARPGRGEW